MVPLNANENTINKAIVKLSSVHVAQDMDMWVVYKKQSVYDEVTDLNFFDFVSKAYTEESSNIPQAFKNSSYNETDGWVVTIKQGAKLSGKITLPSYYQGKPIVQIGDNSRQLSFGCYYDSENVNITHLFWKSSDTEPCKLRVIDDYAFAANSSIKKTGFKYIEIPEGVRCINSSAFFYTGITTISPNGRTAEENSIILPSTLAYIGAVAFNRIFSLTEATINRFAIPSSTCILCSRAFANIEVPITEMTFGSSTQGSKLTYINDIYTTGVGLFEVEDIPDGELSDIFSTSGARGRIDSLLFYCSSTSKENAFQNFMSNSYINKARVTNSGCVRANDFVS